MGRLFEGVPASKDLDIGIGDWPTPYLKAVSIDTRLEILNFFNTEFTDNSINFNFNAEFFEVTNNLKEKIKDRTKIGTKSELFINLTDYVPAEAETTVFVYQFFAHKWDFGATFGIGFVKNTK